MKENVRSPPCARNLDKMNAACKTCNTLKHFTVASSTYAFKRAKQHATYTKYQLTLLAPSSCWSNMHFISKDLHEFGVVQSASLDGWQWPWNWGKQYPVANIWSEKWIPLGTVQNVALLSLFILKGELHQCYTSKYVVKVFGSTTAYVGKVVVWPCQRKLCKIW